MHTTIPMARNLIFLHRKKLDKLKRLLTGYPILSPGTVGLYEIEESSLKRGGTEWLSGGAFLVKKFALKILIFSYLIYLRKKLE